MARLLELQPGEVFAGDYRVAKKLGEGGMGAVYEAEQISTRRRRALKLMLPELVEKPDIRARFEREARVGADIESDHVVEVIASGVDAGSGAPWLVMELLDGEGLEAYVARRGFLPPAEVRDVLDQICHALGAAHEKGIVHRDLKPENVFLAKPRRRGVPFVVKILDFGIAKIVAEVKTTSSKTRGILGSPMWMAPEQADPSKPIGPRADVWALGLVAFHLLTGRYFWKTASVESASVWMLMNEAFGLPMPSASARAAEYGCAERLPPGFDAWFARCVARDASERFADATKANDALAPILGGPASLTPTPPPMQEQAPPPAPPPSLLTVVGTGTEQMPGPPTIVTDGGPPRPKIPTLREPPRQPAAGSGRAALAAVGALVVVGGLGAALWPRKPHQETTPPPVPPPTATTTPSPLPPPPPVPPSPCPEDMVLVPAGTFTMGSQNGQGDADEHPAHKVTLSAFCMDKTEVTVAAYRKCATEERDGAKCATAPTTVQWSGADVKLWSQFCNGDKTEKDAHPVNCVDWSQADAYCKWAGKSLPTEAQWEYAARGPGGKKYPWGDDKPGPKLLNACGTECRAMGARLGKSWAVMYEGDDGAEATAPVGKYPDGASPFGVLDMAGNVWEWVADWYGPYMGSQAPVVDPKGPDKPVEKDRRVARGGGWSDNDASWVRAASRSGGDVTDRHGDVGFRCSRGPK